MNLFIASGNLGRDFEIRYTQNGKAIGTFPLPVKQGYGDHEKTSWVQCKILGDRAEKIAPHLTKGKKVTVSGSFVYEEWDKDGVRHGRPVVIVSDIDLHGGPSQAAQQPQQQRGGQPAAQPQNGQQSAPHSQGGGFDDFDDEIPF